MKKWLHRCKPVILITLGCTLAVRGTVSAQSTPPENAPVVEFRVLPNTDIVVNRIEADAPNTPVWIEIAPGEYITHNIKDVDVSIERFTVKSKVPVLKIYGDHIGVVDLAVNDEKITGVTCVNHPTIWQLGFNDCFVTDVKVAKCPKLVQLDALNCKLQKVRVENCPNLEVISVFGNPLDACALDSLFLSLPNRKGKEIPGEIHAKELDVACPGTFTCRDTIATNRGWILMDVGDPFGGTEDPRQITNTDYACPQTAGLLSPIKNNIGLRVYPNPAYKNATIEAKNAIRRIQVIQLDGKVIHQERNVNALSYGMNLEHIASGDYILLIETVSGETAATRLFVARQASLTHLARP